MYRNLINDWGILIISRIKDKNTLLRLWRLCSIVSSSAGLLLLPTTTYTNYQLPARLQEQTSTNKSHHVAYMSVLRGPRTATILWLGGKPPDISSCTAITSLRLLLSISSSGWHKLVGGSGWLQSLFLFCFLLNKLMKLITGIIWPQHLSSSLHLIFRSPAQ